jgi:hypothetical protein
VRKVRLLGLVTKSKHTRFTASSQAFLSSIKLALLTLTTSRSSGAIVTLNGPVGLSGEECDDSRRRVGLGVDDATDAPLIGFLLRGIWTRVKSVVVVVERKRGIFDVSE